MNTVRDPLIDYPSNTAEMAYSHTKILASIAPWKKESDRITEAEIAKWPFTGECVLAEKLIIGMTIAKYMEKIWFKSQIMGLFYVNDTITEWAKSSTLKQLRL